MNIRENQEKAVIRMLWYGLPDSPGGVGPLQRILKKLEAADQKEEKKCEGETASRQDSNIVPGKE